MCIPWLYDSTCSQSAILLWPPCREGERLYVPGCSESLHPITGVAACVRTAAVIFRAACYGMVSYRPAVFRNCPLPTEDRV